MTLSCIHDRLLVPFISDGCTTALLSGDWPLELYAATLMPVGGLHSDRLEKDVGSYLQIGLDCLCCI